MAEQTTATTSSLVRQLVSKNNEPDWLRSVREGAWQTFEELPSPKLEKTDLTRRAWNVGELSSVVDTKPMADVSKIIEAAGEAPMVYLRDASVIKSQIPSRLTEQGVIVTDLQSALRQHEDLVKAHLGSVVQNDESKWVSLNAALWENGIFVYIPKNVEVEETIQFVYEETSAGGGARPRTLVVAEANSQSSFSEISFVPNEGGKGKIHSAVTEIVAQADARVESCALTNFHKGPTNFVVRRAKVGKDAEVNWVAGDVGDGFTVAVVESRLEESGAQSKTRVLGLGYGRQHLEFTASMDHFGRSSESDITMYGVMLEKANSVYRSSSHIEKGAADAASEQHDRMLVLDKTTRADAIPMLLIDDNNVRRCGHAASVGKIDPVQIYYLMSRGISEKAATKMIVWSYLAPTVDAIPVESFREVVAARIDKELER